MADGDATLPPSVRACPRFASGQLSEVERQPRVKRARKNSPWVQLVAGAPHGCTGVAGNLRTLQGVVNTVSARASMRIPG